MDALFQEEFYSFLFVFAGLALAFLEVFVPSGGVLLICSIVSVGFGVYGLFVQGHDFWAYSTMLVFFGFVSYSFLWLIRRTSMHGSVEASTQTMNPEEQNLAGKTGTSVSPLRPAGLALIDGQKIDVVTRGKFIEKDRAIAVVETSGNRIVVRELQD